MVSGKPFFELVPGVHVLDVPMFPLYVIDGERPVMIDCAVLARAGQIADRMSALLGSRKLAMVLLTHSHYDHAGACSLLQERYGFEIIASQRSKEILENDKAVVFINDLNQKFKAIENDRSATVFAKPRDIRAAGENDRIALPPGRFLEVHETPGHTRCSLSFLLQPENILFAGDAAGVVEKSGRIKPLFLSSYSQYESSLRRLLALDAEVLALAHNTAVRGRNRVHEFLESSLEETRKLKEKIVAWLGASRDFGGIAEKILAEEYDSPTLMGPREALMINVTAMVKSVYHEFVKIP